MAEELVSGQNKLCCIGLRIGLKQIQVSCYKMVHPSPWLFQDVARYYYPTGGDVKSTSKPDLHLERGIGTSLNVYRYLFERCIGTYW